MVFSKIKEGAWALVDPQYKHRWHGVYGDVQAFDLGQGFPVDDTTGDPTQFVSTVVEVGTGTTTFANETTAGRAGLITTAANEYDGTNAQLRGEAFKLTADDPLYFGVALKVSDADAVDLLVGLAETDTALLNTTGSHAVDYGTSDVIGFLSLDATAVVSTQDVVGGVVKAAANASTSLADNTDIILEMYWTGSRLEYYVNGSLVTCVTASFPDGDLTPTINFRSGETAANTCSIKWWKCYQIND